MGRPLKIATAQAVITITNTTATTNVVTTSANFTNLGIIAGMRFVTSSSNIGGLTAGKMYWILAVINSGNNSTFTVSATPLNANPNSTAVVLTTASGTVSTTVAPVDAYFNNPTSGAGYPAASANTYSVVGGNTAIFGSQVLCNVGIGANGTGTLFANTSSNIVIGLGTDLGNVANGTILFDTAGSLIGTVANNVGNLTVAIANTAANGVIGTSGNAQTLVANTPVKFDASFGNLVAGTTYFVKNIANAAAFTVSTTQGGAVKTLSANASVTGNAVQNKTVLSAVASTADNNAAFVQVLPEAGYIVRQKGKTKYLVTGTTTGLTAACYTANVANTALTPNTMTITGTYANTATVKLSAAVDHKGRTFPAAVSVGSLSVGTDYTIYSTGTTDWSTVGAASNLTGVSFTATATGSGTGTAVLSNVNTAIIATFNTAITTVTAGSFVVGNTYVIVSLGNTNWQAIGAPAGAAVGAIFTAKGVGSGTGTASIAGARGPIVTIDNA